MKTALIYPMFLYVLTIFFYAVLNFRSRLNAIKQGHIKLNYFKTTSGENPPERMLTVARHYDNQFQLPMLYFGTCACFIALQMANEWTLLFACLFVASRYVHSYIFLTSNNIRHRVKAFAFGWWMILAMWIQLFINTVQG